VLTFLVRWHKANDFPGTVKETIFGMRAEWVAFDSDYPIELVERGLREVRDAIKLSMARYIQ